MGYRFVIYLVQTNRAVDFKELTHSLLTPFKVVILWVPELFGNGLDLTFLFWYVAKKTFPTDDLCR